MNLRGRHGLYFIGFGFALLLLFLVQAGAAGRDQVKRATAKPAADPAQYVGSEACKACHEDMPAKGFYKDFEKTPHWKTTFAAHPGVPGEGCETCHGPGADHVNAGGDKTKIFSFKTATSKEISERCLTCHEYGEEHSNFARSVHNLNNVTCTDCHSVHHAKEAEFLLVANQPQLCYSCHLEIKPEFSKPFHHRVNEGLVKCTDCHNEHGGFVTKQLRATAAQDQICFKCHVDKAGPFIFEHAVVKTEGCVACHTPHGSPNPRLLKRSQINLLCLECHSPAGGLIPIGPVHNQTQKYQACTLCHAAIHGSNSSAVFFTQ